MMAGFGAALSRTPLRFCVWPLFKSQAIPVGSTGCRTAGLEQPCHFQQVRCYIKHFWAKKTAYPFPGQNPIHQKWFRHRKKLYLQDANHRMSEIRRIRVFGHKQRMSYLTGRMSVMDKILKGEKFLGQS